MKESKKLDSIDLSILEILQENGKITNLQLSKEIGLSPAPTLERVKKLESTGVIKSYHAKVEETALDIGIIAYMQVSLVRQANNAIDKFAQHVQTIDEVVECYQVTGQADLLLKVMVKDIPAFDKMVRDKFNHIAEIDRIETMIVLSTEKQINKIPFEYRPKKK